jgi:flagellar biosynthesis component FlhA
VINNANIKYTNDELNLLNKGLIYNLGYKNKNWIQTLALETETAIAQLPIIEQESIRVRAAYSIKKLSKQQTTCKHQNSNQAKKENYIINQIRKKLSSNLARISKADKGNSIVIMYNKDYNDKIQKYIQNNNFTIMNKNPTTIFQNKIKATLKNCQAIIHKENGLNL